MKLDTGLVVVMLAVLVFYLRLITLQRQKAKRVNLERQAQASAAAKKGGKKGNQGQPPARQVTDYSILSPNKPDRVGGIAGVVLILAGVFLYSGLNPWPAAADYWWLPMAAGIVLFSWLFQLGSAR